MFSQARGRAKVRDQSDWLADQLKALTAAREAACAAPWSVSDAPSDYIDAQMRHIVGIEIEIAALEGKWKVSQNQPDETTREMAELVRIYGKLE